MSRSHYFACVALFLAACSTTFQPAQLDTKTGRFASESGVDSVEVQSPFLASYTKLLYVMTDSKIDSYNDFFIKTFADMGTFSAVDNKSNLEALVIQRNLTDKVSNVSDLVGLNRLSKEIGPFAIVEPSVIFLGGFQFKASLKVTDASTGQVVFKVTNTATNWAGLDKPLFYPLFNAFLDWTKGRPIKIVGQRDSQ